MIRMWLPDRPGALGQVASRIGAVRGDVVGIDILERDGGQAVDELVVELPDAGLVDLLVNEVRQVDGVAVEEVRRWPTRSTTPGSTPSRRRPSSWGPTTRTACCRPSWCTPGG